MRGPAYIVALMLAADAFSETLPEEPRYVNSRAIVLSFGVANSAEIGQVHVWFSKNDSETWNAATVTPVAAHALRFDAEQDGKYCFYIVLENQSGRSADPPVAGSPPHVAVVVDTTPPTLQIHRARESTSPTGEPRIRLNISLVDENLGEAAARLFYRAGDGDAWHDGGPVTSAGGILNWQPPPDVGPECDLRLVVTDRAGNQASDEINRVSVIGESPDRPPVASPSGPRLSEGSRSDAVEQVHVPPVQSTTVDPVPSVTLDERPSVHAASQPAPEVDERAQRLREQAARYLAEGRLSLAGARLHDALQFAPGNADLHADLGEVLVRTRQYDEAARRFHSALDACPDHTKAIEGLALVAISQNRYPEARSYLQQLLRLSPESGAHWLHYGDIEHRLGNITEARAAWQKLLESEAADSGLREQAEKRLRAFGPKRSDAD
jgi:hypothetical protein